MAVPDRSDCRLTTRETSLRSEVFVDELSTAGGPARPWRPRKAQLASPPAEGPSGNRKSGPGHVNLTTSALSSGGLRPAGSSFLEPAGNCGHLAASWWSPGEGAAVKAWLRGRRRPFGKSRSRASLPSPGRFGAEALRAVPAARAQ